MQKLFIQTLKLLSLVLLFSQSTKSDTGFYYGLALGHSHLSGNSTVRADRTNAGVRALQNNNVNHSASNFHGELFVGYGQFVENFWLAGEVHFGLSSLETKSLLSLADVNFPQTLTIRSSHNTGMAFHVGRQMNPTTKAYIKLGVEMRKFRNNFDGKNRVADNITSLEKSYYSTAFVPGFGIETEVDKNVTMRTEYKYSIHPVKNHAEAGKLGSKTNLKTKSAIHSINVGLHLKI